MIGWDTSNSVSEGEWLYAECSLGGRGASLFVCF